MSLRQIARTVEYTDESGKRISLRVILGWGNAFLSVILFGNPHFAVHDSQHKLVGRLAAARRHLGKPLVEIVWDV